MRGRISIKSVVTVFIIILISVAFSFSLFTYGEKMINIRLRKQESDSLVKILDLCNCGLADSIKEQIKRQQ